MNVDDIVKLVLSFSIAFSVVVVSIQLARMFGKISDAVSSGTKSIDDMNKITGMITEDYTAIRTEARKIVGVYQSIKSGALSSAIGVVTNIFKQEKKEKKAAPSKKDTDTEISLMEDIE